jgi:hypothetical protein
LLEAIGLLRNPQVCAAESKSQGDDVRMNEMPMTMMWGMGIVWLLVLILVVLAIAALIKYLRT